MQKLLLVVIKMANVAQSRVPIVEYQSSVAKIKECTVLFGRLTFPSVGGQPAPLTAAPMVQGAAGVCGAGEEVGLTVA